MPINRQHNPHYDAAFVYTNGYETTIKGDGRNIDIRLKPWTYSEDSWGSPMTRVGLDLRIMGKGCFYEFSTSQDTDFNKELEKRISDKLFALYRKLERIYG